MSFVALTHLPSESVCKKILSIKGNIFAGSIIISVACMMLHYDLPTSTSDIMLAWFSMLGLYLIVTILHTISMNKEVDRTDVISADIIICHIVSSIMACFAFNSVLFGIASTVYLVIFIIRFSYCKLYPLNIS